MNHCPNQQGSNPADGDDIKSSVIHAMTCVLDTI